MKLRTKVRAGGLVLSNHNERIILPREPKQKANSEAEPAANSQKERVVPVTGLKLKTGTKAGQGAIWGI